MKSLPIEIHDKAKQMLVAITDYYAEFGGMSSVDNLLEIIRGKCERISHYPESGTPEPLLADRQNFYRFVILNRRIKMVYFVEDEVIHVAAFWDMRMSPEKLKWRI
ncbi:MAG: type II toxin-antitoxin system RelE/ParE family toxin [Prevotella sp.]|nr:type II toxin-antitoxin system RelE/ParE family toxin [Prevotella sp.]